MGFSFITPKDYDAGQWIDAQTKYHYGKCVGFWHKLFYRQIKWFASRIFPDKSSAELHVCKKCNGIKEAFITIRSF